MHALFGTGRKLSILALIACGTAQFSCPLLWLTPGPEKPVVASYGCHNNHQMPAPEQKKCCIASHSQQAAIAVRYIAPELIDNPESDVADFTVTASATKELVHHHSCSSLRYSGPVLRI